MLYTRTFSSLGCPELDLDQTLALATRHGLDAVELRALGGTVELVAHLAGAFGSPEELARWMAGRPVRILSLDTSFHLIGDGARERDSFLEFVPWAEALGVPRLRVFDGGRSADEAELAQAVETAEWWRASRKREGWQTEIMVETHDALITTAAIQRLVAAVPGIAILWDAHHTWKRGGEDPVTTWETIKTSVVHVHVKDSLPVPSGRHPFTYVLPGDGQFPMAPLRNALVAENFRGAVSLEWERMWHPDLVPLDHALATANERQWW